MKTSWFKYLFASILIGLSAGIYQMWIQKSRSLPLSELEQLQDQQIGNFGISELNRAARIAQKEQQFEDIDFDIPVMFEEYDQPMGHVPSEKTRKAAQSYDPNAGLSIDRSNSPAFGQMPLEQPMQDPEFSSQMPYIPSDYTPSKSSGSDRKPTSSKAKNEEAPQDFSKIEYPQEDKVVSDKFDKSSLKHPPSKSLKNDFEKTKAVESKSTELPKSADIQEEPQNISSDDGTNPLPSEKPAQVLSAKSVQFPSEQSVQPKSLWEKLRNKFWDWWKNENNYSDRSTARMPEPENSALKDEFFDNNTEPDSTDDNSKRSGENFEIEKALPNPVDLKITSKPADVLIDPNPLAIPDRKKIVQHDTLSHSAGIQKSIGHPSKSVENFEIHKAHIRNELVVPENSVSSQRPRLPEQTHSVEILEPEVQQKLSEPERITEVEFIEPKAAQMAKNEIRTIQAGHEQLKNKFFKGSNFRQDPRFISMPQAIPQLEPSRSIEIENITPSKERSLKVRRLTSEEEIAREMEMLGLLNHGNPLMPLPYEQRSEADPFGQLYVMKSPSTGQEFVGTVEEIAEFLEQRPWWRKIADAFVKNRENSKDITFEHSEGTAPEFVQPLTDDQRIDRQIEVLFEGPNAPKVEDMTKEIMPSSSTGPVTWSESASRIASDVGSEAGAIAAGGSTAARLAP